MVYNGHTLQVSQEDRMDFRDHISRDQVMVLSKDSKKDALTELIDLAARSRYIRNPRKVREGVFHREQLMSTGIGLGIAIPHVRVSGLRKAHISVGLHREGIADYASIDDRPVRIIFLIVGVKGQQKEYITLLSQIVRFLKEDHNLRNILACRDADCLYQLLTA